MCNINKNVRKPIEVANKGALLAEAQSDEKRLKAATKYDPGFDSVINNNNSHLDVCTHSPQSSH